MVLLKPWLCLWVLFNLWNAVVIKPALSFSSASVCRRLHWNRRSRGCLGRRTPAKHRRSAPSSNATCSTTAAAAAAVQRWPAAAVAQRERPNGCSVTLRVSPPSELQRNSRRSSHVTSATTASEHRSRPQVPATSSSESRRWRRRSSLLSAEVVRVLWCLYVVKISTRAVIYGFQKGVFSVKKSHIFRGNFHGSSPCC